MLQQLKFSRQKKQLSYMEILTTSGSLGWDPGPFLGDMAVDHQGHFFHKAMKGGDSETLTN